MGFSPGQFLDTCTDQHLHWEGKGDGSIILWGPGEIEILAHFSKAEARKARDYLNLLIEMSEGDSL